MVIMQGQSLVCSAYMYGNTTSLINDPRVAPYTNPKFVPLDNVNCKMKLVAVGGWPMLFVIATKDILPGFTPSALIVMACSLRIYRSAALYSCLVPLAAVELPFCCPVPH